MRIRVDFDLTVTTDRDSNFSLINSFNEIFDEGELVVENVLSVAGDRRLYDISGSVDMDMQSFITGMKKWKLKFPKDLLHSAYVFSGEIEL